MSLILELNVRKIKLLLCPMFDAFWNNNGEREREGKGGRNKRKIKIWIIKESVGPEVKTKSEEHTSGLHIRNNLMKFQSWPQWNRFPGEAKGCIWLDVFKEKVLWSFVWSVTSNSLIIDEGSIMWYFTSFLNLRRSEFPYIQYWFT